MTADPGRSVAGTRLRADARRNRDQLLAAARALFSEQGPDVPMEEIARRAGVGVGTLYRRFTDRDTLIRALAIDTFAHLLADARTAEAQEPDAWRALSRFLRLSIHLRLVVRLSMLSPRASRVIGDAPETGELRRSLLEILDRLVATAQAEGTLRTDVGAGDLTALIAMVIREMPSIPDADAAVVSQRCITLMLDGLAAHPGSPLPGRPMSIADIAGWAV